MKNGSVEIIQGAATVDNTHRRNQVHKKLIKNHLRIQKKIISHLHKNKNRLVSLQVLQNLKKIMNHKILNRKCLIQNKIIKN